MLTTFVLISPLEKRANNKIYFVKVWERLSELIHTKGFNTVLGKEFNVSCQIVA